MAKLEVRNVEREKQVIAELSKALSEEQLSVRSLDLETYGRDWTRRFQPDPMVVCFPKTVEQVQTVVRICAAHETPIVPSGGRTGLAGGAVAANREVVLSLERMNQILHVDGDAMTVRVQSGVVHQTLQDSVAPLGLFWPIDLASKGSSQIGGNIATNAGGLRVVRYGHCRAWVLSVQVVLADGSLHEFHGDLEKNNTGYDLKQLFIGSEGTLGIITAATLKLTKKFGETAVALAGIDDLELAPKILGAARRAGLEPLAAEFFSRECLEAVRSEQALGEPLERKFRFYMLVEFETRQPGDVETLAEVFAAHELEHVALGADESSRRALWVYRETITESLSRLGAVYKNDLSLPLKNLAGFVATAGSMPEIAAAGAEPFFFGHFGDGNVHLNLVKRGATPDQSREFFQFCEAFNHRLFSELRDQGGSIAAEHGIGLLKREYLHYTRSAADIKLMRAIKFAFDPKSILNPGKIF